MPRTYKIKSNESIPSEKFKHLRVQYLLLIFMRISPIKKSSVFVGGDNSCSSFLENNVDYIFNVREHPQSFRKRMVGWLTNAEHKIILHVDAEKNSGLCGILPRIRDFALSNQTNKRVEYTKNLSSKEYDAAVVQSSETYVDLLKNSSYSFKKNVATTKSAKKCTINLRWEDKVILSFSYERNEVPNFAPEFFRIIGYKLTNSNILKQKNSKILKQQIDQDIKKYNMSRKELIYFNYVFVIIRNQMKPNQAQKTIPPRDITIADLIDSTFNNLIEYHRNTTIAKNIREEVINSVKKKTFYANFSSNYNIADDITRDSIILTIDRAYSVDTTKFGKDIGAINPFSASAQVETITNNQNLSYTSSLRSVTNGAHFDKDHRFVLFSPLMKEKQKEYQNRIWFKHLGDFGQALEFYAYTHIPDKKFSPTVWPIFLSYDKLSAYLSSIFNPLTCLEDLKKDSIAKLQFYTKLNLTRMSRVPIETLGLPGSDPMEGGFGRVNYHSYNKRVYNNRVYNNRFYNKRVYNISRRLKLMTEQEIKNKLKSVNIKITKNVRGKRRYLSRKELENKALLFNKESNLSDFAIIKIAIQYCVLFSC